MKKIILFTVILFLSFYSMAQAIEIVRQKNVATYITFPIVDADGDIVTGAAGLDSEIDQWTDAAAPNGFADCTNEATEISTTGEYYLSLAQAEMNTDYIIIQVKTSTSGAKTQHILIRTIVGDPLNVATTDDGGAINVTSGKVDEVATLTGHTAQTGDTYARLGAPVGASISADIAAVKSDTAAILTDTAAMDTSTELRTLLTGSDTAVSTLTASSNIGINWANIAAPTTTVNLSGTTISTSQAVASVSGAVGSVTGAVGSVTGGVTVTTNNDKTGYTASTVSDKTGYSLSSSQTFNMTGNITGSLSGSVGSVTGAVASVTGAVGSVTGGVTVTTNNDKTGYSLSVAAIQAIWDALTSALTTANSIGKLLVDNINATISSRSTLTAANVWQTDISGYSTAGQAGTYLKGAGSAGDPWVTSLPGSYTSGQAGYIIGTNLNATIGSRSSHSASDVATLILTTPANKLATDTSGRVTVGSNADKSGYSLTQSFPTNFSSLSISATTGLVDITQTAADKAWGTTARALTDKSGFGISSAAAGDYSEIGTDVWVIGTRTITGGIISTNSDKTGYTVSTVSDKTGYALSAAGIDSIWDEVQTGHTTGSSFGKYLDAQVSTVGGGSLTAQAIWEYNISAFSTAGYAGTYLKNAGDPWSIDISSGYTDQAGAYLRNIYNATDGDKESGAYTGIENLIRIHR